MRRVRRTDLARDEIADALDYLEERSAVAAERLTAMIEEKCRLLATNPFMGRARDELRPGHRSVVVGDYLLFYRVTDFEVIVVRFLHGRRDLPTALDADPT
ncbi:MAG: type II toxin-antitoxin system RelE/ParE family toxin [Gemmataceae bacterium]